MATERLKDFPAKTVPVLADIIYLGDSADSFSEVQSTIAQIMSASYPISLANGGTGRALTASNGGIVYTDASKMQVLSGTATGGQIVRSGSNTAPSWSTATFASTYTASSILYSNGANTVQGLATLNSASLVTSATGVPTWLALTNGQLAIGSTGAIPVAGSLTAGNNITITPGAGSITIANTLAISAGVYTPTLTNVANLDASTSYQAQYSRIGNTVTVSGKVDVDPTANVSTQLGISLPIASNLANAQNCAGTAFSPTIAGQGAAILGDTVNDRAQMEWIAVDTTNQSMYYTFSYVVV